MSYIVRQKTRNGGACIHLAENHYIPELQQARQSRKHIGVLDPATGELRLASGIPEPDATLLALLEKAGIAYTGKRAAPRGRKPLASSRAGRLLAAEDRSVLVEEVGEVYVMELLARDSGLESALCEALGQKEGLAVLWTAMHQACTAEAQYLAGEWLEDRKLPQAVSDFDFSSGGLSHLSEALGRSTSCRHHFFQKWIATCGRPESIILDTTSMSTYSDNLDLAEWGHNRDEESLPQINFSLGIGSISHLPLAYRINFGSIPDVATLQATSEFLREYGLTRLTYSADKGFWSNSNVAAMIRDQIQFVMGVPLTSKQAKALIKKHRHKLDARTRSLLHDGHVVHYICDELTIPMKGVDDPKAKKKTRDVAVVKAVLFMEPERVTSLTAELERKTLEIERIAAKEDFDDLAHATVWLRENAKDLAKYFSVSDGTRGIQVTRKIKAIARRCNEVGVGVYATNRAELTPENVLAITRSRDAVEKVFDIIKNEDGQRRLRTGNGARVEGRLFIAFVAAILRVLLENRMRDADLIKTRTAAEAMALLRKIKRIRYASGNVRQLEVPKKTRVLLDAMKIPVPV